MLDDCPIAQERAAVQRLVSVPDQGESARTILLRRGARPEDLDDVLPIISAKTPSTLEEVLDDAFRPRLDTNPPYREGRFGDGSFAVYYSALEEDTCKKEIAYHLREQAKDLVEDPDPRAYRVIACRYDGITVNLLGKESEHADLTSNTSAGYPYCQSLAHEAVARGHDGFLTASARKPDGTCVPVFKRTALSEPRAGNGFLATIRGGRVQFQAK
ncbi:MAG: RES family NAD+ phosphorylase [Boseongicola sp. SB0662_bin_57]|nr:RES family NAD+ phosphorylase [Boseongicola sp. SB0662_bin_57]